jgi:hypothetical protein
MVSGAKRACRSVVSAWGRGAVRCGGGDGRDRGEVNTSEDEVELRWDGGNRFVRAGICNRSFTCVCSVPLPTFGVVVLPVLPALGAGVLLTSECFLLTFEVVVDYTRNLHGHVR